MKPLADMNVKELAAYEAQIAQERAKRKPEAVAFNVAKRMKISGGDVADATEPLEITITKSDCKLGALKNSTACAAARAICRQGYAEARVHVARTYVKRTDGKWLRYVTPVALRREIVAFDRGGAFEPGDYRLPPVQPAERIGARAKRKGSYYRKTKEQRAAAPKRKNHVTTGIRSRFLPD